MKRTKNLIILCAALVVLVLAIIGVKSIKTHIDKINAVDEVVFTINEEELTGIKWSYDGNDLEFAKDENGVWKSTDDAAFPVNQETFKSFISTYESIHASFIITDVEDYDQYGLSKPECTVHFTLGEKEKYIELGGFSTMDSKRYIYVGDNNVYLVDTDPLDKMVSERDDFIQNDKMITFDQVTELTVSGENNLKVIYTEDKEYSYNDGEDYFLVEGSNYKGLSSSMVSSYLKNITGMSLTDFATYTASGDDLSQYGLDKPALTIHITGQVTEDDAEEAVQKSTTLYIGTTVTKSDDTETVNAFARLEDSELVYSISSTSYDKIVNGDYNSLRASELLACDNKVIDRITISIDDDTYQLDHLLTEDTEEYQLDGIKLEDASTMVSTIKSISVVEFTENGTLQKTNAETGEMEAVPVSIDGKKKELSLVVALNNSYGKRTIEFYRYDGYSCLVAVDGELVGIVNRSAVIDTVETIYGIALSL